MVAVRPERPRADPGAAGAVEAAPLPAPRAWSSGGQYADHLLQLQSGRRRRFLLRFAGFVGLPALLTLAYMLFWAAPRYVSEFEITYQTFRPPQSLSSGLVQSVAGTAQSNTVDLGAILYEYVRSDGLLARLDGQFDLRGYDSRRTIDFLSRLGAGASRERFLAYYRRQVAVSEGLGGYLTVDVQAFDPGFAQALAKAIVAACDAMLDDMTARARQDEVRFAEDELARQETRVRRAREALMEFQNAHGDEDPQRMAGQLGQIVGSLEADLTTARSQLADAGPYLSAGSPIVQQLKSRIASLEQQLVAARARLATTDGGKPYSKILAEYSALQMEEDFARSAYTSAQQGLAVARADAARKQNYLIDFAPPNLPDQPSLYYPVVYTVSVFLGCLIVWAFCSLVGAAFRDQAGM